MPLKRRPGSHARPAVRGGVGAPAPGIHTTSVNHRNQVEAIIGSAEEIFIATPLP